MVHSGVRASALSVLGVILLLLLCIVGPARGDDLLPVGTRVEVILDDGTTILGTVAEVTEAQLVLDSTRFGRQGLARSEIQSIRELPAEEAPDATRESAGEDRPDVRSQQPAGEDRPDAKSPRSAGQDRPDAKSPQSTGEDRHPNGWFVDPDYNSLLLVPTSETLPQGDSYYRNFELLFNNLGVSLTDEVNLSFMAAFPVTSDFTVFGLGAKVRLLSREESGIGLAIAGGATFADSEDLETLAIIASVGDRRRSFTGSFNVGLADGESATFFLAGADIQFAPRAKLVVEYGNSSEGFLEDEFYGIINAGVRIFWTSTSFTITGFRPLDDDVGDLIAFPLVSFSAHF